MPAEQITMACGQCSDLVDYETEMRAGLCSDCFEHVEENITFSCDNCGDMLIDDYLRSSTSFGTDVAECLFNYRVSESNHTDSGECVCTQCVAYCEECDASHPNDEAAFVCCQNDHIEIHSYNFRPYVKFWTLNDGRLSYNSYHPNFRKDPTAFLPIGMELELERAADHVSAFIQETEEDVVDPKFVYFKHDGSLGSYGVELVTMPATLDAFVQRFPWDALENMYQKGARSYAYENCGMHFHVSKLSFTPSHMLKFARFQMRNSHRCSEIARRFNSNWAQWTMDDNERLINIVKKKDVNPHRYVAINFQNPDTIELRYFKGNITKQGIMRNIEFVDALFYYTKRLSVMDVRDGGMRWLPFVRYVEDNADRYPHLLIELNDRDNNNEEH